MKLLYLDCSMGAAGDMLMAALLELHPQPKAFLEKMNGLGIPGVHIHRMDSTKCGIRGTHMCVFIHGHEEDHHHHDHDHDHHHDHDHGHHHHASLGNITALIDSLDIPEAVRASAKAVYEIIAKAESTVHGQDMALIHFHEVGTLDAVADVVGVCLLIHELGVERIVASPVHVGSGTVRCAHGILPVPAPATALILSGVPIYGGEIRGELCTPTGAALLRHFVSEFGPMPAMVPAAWGYGMGTRDFPAANCLRAAIGESGEWEDEVVELSCNVDDMTGEDIAFACDELLSAGALDVWTAPITMKKGRPAVLLSCMVKPVQQEALTALILRHTSTLGVRSRTWQRTVMDRREEVVDTAVGPMRRKISSYKDISRSKWEHADLADAARREGLSLSQVREKIEE